MTNGVLMVIRGFIEENYQEFAKYCGNEEIADGNLHEFKLWLSETLRSEISELEALRKDKVRLKKEADWLAVRLSECNSDSDYCLPYCPYHIDKQPAYCDYDENNAEEAACDGELPCTHKRENCWREAARKAVEAQE